MTINKLQQLMRTKSVLHTTKIMQRRYVFKP